MVIKKQKPIPVPSETLSGLIEKDLQLWAYCVKCSKEKILNPAIIIVRQGDGPVPDVGKRWRCECGHCPVSTRPNWTYESLHDTEAVNE